MKKLKLFFVIALAFLLVVPFGVFAEGEEEAVATENKEVTLYFFRGEGCSHCAEFEAWLQEIEPEYGSLFEVKDYETWYNEENQKLMTKVAKTRGEEAQGVPYIIIGNKSWNGFADEYKSEIISEIQELYNTEPSARYDVMNYIKKDAKESNKVTSGDFIATLVIALVAFLVVFGIVKARKSSK